jgi:hypothetical protein
MATSMRTTLGSRRTPSLALLLVLPALSLPATAGAATDTSPPTHRSASQPTFPIPASARVHGADQSTTVPAPSAVTTSTAPAGPATAPGATAAGTSTAPAGTAPAGTSTAPATTTSTPATAAPTSAGTLPASARRSKTGARRLSTGAIVAAALAALLIVLCLLWGAARWWAYEPRWTVSLRHSLAEASWRLSASWDEFSDWARIGR